MHNEEDRFSTLPDELIHHILSSGVDLNEVVQTCVLSKRLVNLWTTLSFLNFGVPCFNHTSYLKYADFLTKFLSFRNQESDTCSMRVDFSSFHDTNHVLNIVNYAISHNVAELHIANAGITSYLSFPVLRNLSIHRCHVALMDWNLPCLTTLYLNDVTFVDDALSFKEFHGLKNLSLGGFFDMYLSLEVFRIESCNVETLTIFQGTSLCSPDCKFVVSAPKLRCFRFAGRDVPVFSTEGGFPCLEVVDFDFNIGSRKVVNIDPFTDLRRYINYDCNFEDVKELLRLFNVFRKTKVLTLYQETIEVLYDLFLSLYSYFI